jgi:MFS superfamily sulfate permease-like transporter
LLYPSILQLIGLSQVKYIFGYNVAKGDTVYEILKSLFDNISKFNYRTFLMGMGSLAVLIAFKKLGTRHKGLWFLKMIGPLTVSAVGIVLVAAFGLQDKGIPIVFTIPRGLPPVTVNLWFPIEDVGTLMPGVVTIVLVGLMESIAIAKQLAKRHQYKINAGMELYGLGMSNVAAALFSGYPITGSFSRSAVNSEAGAQSQVSGVVAATLGT